MHHHEASHRLSPKITAVVVCHNEAHHMQACLERLTWVDELLVVDLASTDDSAAIAHRFAHRVITQGHSPIVEPVRCTAARMAKHDWLLFVDPDERYPDSLIDDVRVALACDAQPDHRDAGIIELPMHYYFKRRRLRCTAWGKPVHYRPALVNRQRCDIRPLICRGFELREGFRRTRVDGHATSDNCIVHYWIDSYRELFSKHVRYVAREGYAQWLDGKRFGFRAAVTSPAIEFKRNLIDRAGLQGGPRGVILSVVYSLYHAVAAWMLLYHRIRRGPATAFDSTRAQPADANIAINSTQAPSTRHAA